MSDIADLLLRRLAATNAPEAVAELVLAAVDAADLTGPGTTTHPLRETYLRGVHVARFRGIGPSTTLELQPVPGLTLVTGRNGAGKSSFAEAAEVALTGTSSRWADRHAVWRDGWRNLHAEGPTRVMVDLVHAGDPEPLRISRTWTDDDGLDGGMWTRQRRGDQPLPHDESLLGAELKTYRPFLSYGELGALVDGAPSKLYDALFGLLGLGGIAEVQRRIADDVKAGNSAKNTDKRERDELLGRLSRVDDDRARRACELLGARSPDLDALDALAVGTDTSDTHSARLRTLAGLTLPDVGDVDAALTSLGTAVDAVVAASTGDAQRARDTATLLDAAVAHVSRHGTDVCPVCERPGFDADEAAGRAADARKHAAEADRVHREHGAARRTVRALATSVPSVLDPAGAAAQAWARWVDTVADESVVGVAQRVRKALADVEREVTTVRDDARRELATLDDGWRPHATALAGWSRQARSVRDDATRLAELTKAKKWLADAADALRNERMTGLSDAAGTVWRELRQQSSIELGSITLAGTTTSRRVSLDVSIDDSAAVRWG